MRNILAVRHLVPLGAVLVGLATGGVAGTWGDADREAALHEQLGAAEAHLERSETQVQDVESELAGLRDQFTDFQARQADLDKRQADLDQRQVDLDAKSADLDRREAATKSQSKSSSTSSSGLTTGAVEREVARQWNDAYGTDVLYVKCEAVSGGRISDQRVGEALSCDVEDVDGMSSVASGIVTSRSPYFEVTLLTD